MDCQPVGISGDAFAWAVVLVPPWVPYASSAREPRNGVAFLGVQHKQISLGAHARHKWTVGNLSSKRGIPPPGDAGAARRAATLRREEVACNQITVAFNQKLLALRATRVLPVADHARQVPGIDVTQACPLADLCCPHHRLAAGVLWI